MSSSPGTKDTDIGVLEASDIPDRPAGRFAPSPTGQLHFGSLVAAMASYLDVKSRGGRWLVRVEDLDPPREVPGAAEDILTDLERLGMTPDADIVWQSRRQALYADALRRLRDRGLAFECACTRRQLPENGVYPGTCRDGLPPGRRGRSVRLRVPDETLEFRDRIQGRQRQNLAREVGDFVIRRADGLTAYQLAVVVDDAAQGITEVVRGADLLDSTPRQIWLQRCLGLPTPRYAHLPLALGPDGAKLSKRRRSDPLRGHTALTALKAGLAFLGQPPPRGIADVETFWEAALEGWDISRVPRAAPRASAPKSEAR